MPETLQDFQTDLTRTLINFRDIRFVSDTAQSVQAEIFCSGASLTRFKPPDIRKFNDPGALQLMLTSDSNINLEIFPFVPKGKSTPPINNGEQLNGGAMVFVGDVPVFVITEWRMLTDGQNQGKPAYYLLNFNRKRQIGVRDEKQPKMSSKTVEKFVDNDSEQGRGLRLPDNRLWVEYRDGNISVNLTLPDVENNLLLNTKVPDLYETQLEKIYEKSLRAQVVRDWNPQTAQEALDLINDQAVIAVDMGGEKLVVQVLTVINGKLLPGKYSKPVIYYKENNGENYLTALSNIAKIAKRLGIPVGISIAGKVDGTRVLDNPNIAGFIKALNRDFGGDLANMFTGIKISGANDAVTGIMSATLEAHRLYPKVSSVLLPIIGSGIGGAIFTEGKIIACEPGHIVPVIDELNPHRQNKPCGFMGQSETCLELVGAGQAGIEDIWQIKTGQPINGREIARRFLLGDPLARELYANSALILAHIIEGMRSSFALANDTVVVMHGGVTRVPTYTEAVKQIVAKAWGGNPNIFRTSDYTRNASLEGAGIAGLLTTKSD